MSRMDYREALIQAKCLVEAFAEQAARPKRSWTALCSLAHQFCRTSSVLHLRVSEFGTSVQPFVQATGVLDKFVFLAEDLLGEVPPGLPEEVDFIRNTMSKIRVRMNCIERAQERISRLNHGIGDAA